MIEKKRSRWGRALIYLMLTVCLGEVIACGVLGLILYYALRGSRDRIFRTES